ncbi:SCO7613 C-terminal domain-containing membrane protein [Nonomuraea sp. NPDC059194]|uniref:SCO7613 C-terminal domain-containing membrane protein n=1 Tax=Nonomuraea sp. NPDC059194 TaxID=3346764 RepID=UPI00368D6175
MSRRTAQNTLLILGGLMLAVAAIVFTVVSWGHLGIGGRAAILAGLTGVTLAVPAVLLRRGLNATAETIGVLGLALMLLDGYAARRVGLVSGLDGLDYTAATLVVVAATAAVYGRVLPLKVPQPLAVVLLQVPLPLLSLGHGYGWSSAALAATVALDAAIWTFATRSVRVTATVCLAFTGTIALLWAGVASFGFDGAWHAVGLVMLAAVGGYVAFRSADMIGRGVAALGSAMALVGAVGAFAFRPLPEEWRVVPYTLAALAVTALARLLPVRLRAPYVYSGAGLALVSGFAVTPQTLIVMMDAPVMADELWIHGPLVMLRAAPVIFALLASLPLIVGKARWAVPVFAVAAVLVAPVVYGLPYTVVVGVQLLVALGCTFAAVRFAPAPWAWLAGFAGGFAVLWSLDQRAVAYMVLGALLVAWGALYRRPAALVGAALSGAGLVWVALDGLGVLPRDAAATGLAVGAALALLGWYGTRCPAVPAGPFAGPGGAEAVGSTDAGMPGGGVAGAAGSGFGGLADSWAGLVGRVMAAVALLVVGDVVVGTLGAYLGVFEAWSGAPVFAGGRTWALVVVGVAGAVLALATRPAFGVLVGAVVVAAVPVAVAVPYPVVLVVMVVAVGLAAAVAAGGRGGAVARWTSTGAALWLGSVALGWGLAVETATLAVLPALAAIAALTGLLWEAHPRTAGPGVAGGGTGGRPGGMGAGHPDAAGRRGPGHSEGLGHPGGAGRLQGPGHSDSAGRVEGAGALTLGARFWWMVLAGVLVAGEVVAVAASFGVRVVEAYTLPFAVLLLVVGWWRARGGEMSSWPVYAPGLALAFGPSLVQEATPLRALLLGGAALVVTLAGARWRLQAPTVMGGITVAVVAVRELAPWVAELFGVVPRWVPMALGGLLLVVVGATYEARKRDMRRLRDAVARLR